MNPETLTWRLLTADELTKVYLNEMRRDFPQSELKPLSMILNSEAAGTAHTWGVFDGDAILLLLEATVTVRVLMYRPSSALKATNAQHMAPMPNFFKLVLFSVTTNMPMPPTLVAF